jgi:hypothetical protein
MSNIRVEILAVAMSCAVACNADERRDLGSAQLTQDIQIADLVGPSGTGFFPVGFFVDGHQVDVPDPVTGFPTHNGYFIAGAPVDAKDASRYYDETLSQMRSLGMNSLVAVNVDLIGTANDDHLKALAAKPSTTTRLLLTLNEDRNKDLRATLPPPLHPRAEHTMLTGLSLWLGQPCPLCWMRTRQPVRSH